MNKHRIVIVEDEESILAMYKLKLELAGYNVKTAVNGREGLRLIKEFVPALVLLDLHMPVMNGEEMLVAMRKQAWAADIRVMILTNISRSEAPPSLRFLGVERYIIKAHHTPSHVAKAVGELLGS